MSQEQVNACHHLEINLYFHLIVCCSTSRQFTKWDIKCGLHWWQRCTGDLQNKDVKYYDNTSHFWTPASPFAGRDCVWHQAHARSSQQDRWQTSLLSTHKSLLRLSVLPVMIVMLRMLMIMVKMRLLGVVTWLQVMPHICVLSSAPFQILLAFFFLYQMVRLTIKKQNKIFQIILNVHYVLDHLDW